MTEREDFILTEIYSLTNEDKEIISRNSSNPLIKEDWEKKGLNLFKGRVRDFLAPRQQKLCAYCRTRINVGAFFYPIDHIVPKSLHLKWMFEPQNYCISCTRCNSSKLDKEILVNPDSEEYPQNSNGFNIINPYHDIYSDHIELIEDLFYSGKTDKGRQTIDTCNLTRYDLVLERIETHLNADVNYYASLIPIVMMNKSKVDDFEKLIEKINDDIKHLVFPK